MKKWIPTIYCESRGFLNWEGLLGLLEMLSLMAKEMAKEEHLRQQQGKESSKAVRCREGRAVEIGSFKEAEAEK